MPKFLLKVNPVIHKVEPKAIGIPEKIKLYTYTM